MHRNLLPIFLFLSAVIPVSAWAQCPPGYTLIGETDEYYVCAQLSEPSAIEVITDALDRALNGPSEMLGPNYRLRKAIVESAVSFLKNQRAGYHWGGKYRVDRRDGQRHWICVASNCRLPADQHDNLIDCSGLTEASVDMAACAVRGFYEASGPDFKRTANALQNLRAWQQADVFLQHNALRRPDGRRFPGDLLFWDWDGKGIKHVGIYLGKDAQGQEHFIHASSSKRSVQVAILKGDLIQHLVAVGDISALAEALEP